MLWRWGSCFKNHVSIYLDISLQHPLSGHKCKLELSSSGSQWVYSHCHCNQHCPGILDQHQHQNEHHWRQLHLHVLDKMDHNLKMTFTGLSVDLCINRKKFLCYPLEIRKMFQLQSSWGWQCIIAMHSWGYIYWKSNVRIALLSLPSHPYSPATRNFRPT